MAITSLKNKPPVVVPDGALKRAGFKRGQELEFRAGGGVITIVRKPPSADDEYTPEQRRIVDAQVAKGLADIKARRTHGPFDTVDEMIAHMKARLKREPPPAKRNGLDKDCVLAGRMLPNLPDRVRRRIFQTSEISGAGFDAPIAPRQEARRVEEPLVGTRKYKLALLFPDPGRHLTTSSLSFRIRNNTLGSMFGV